MSYRPQATHKDANHFIPRDYLRNQCGGFETVVFGRTYTYTANFRGFAFVLFDMSNYGGVFSDWLLFCMDTGEYRWLEVKTPEAYKTKNHGLKDGEKWLGLTFGEKFVFVVTDDDFENTLEDMIKDSQ